MDGETPRREQDDKKSNHLRAPQNVALGAGNYPGSEAEQSHTKKLTGDIIAVSSVDCSDRSVRTKVELEEKQRQITLWTTLMSPGGPKVTLCEDKQVDSVELYKGLEVHTQYFGSQLQVLLNGTVKNGHSCKSFIGTQLYAGSC